MRDDGWSEAIAVGSLAFVETVKNNLGVKARHRDVIRSRWKLCTARTGRSLRLNFAGENEALKHQNTFLGMKPLMKQGHSFVRP